MTVFVEQDKEAGDEGSRRVRGGEGRCSDSRHWSAISKRADRAPRGAAGGRRRGLLQQPNGQQQQQQLQSCHFPA